MTALRGSRSPVPPMAARLRTYPAYSYRNDPGVPAFPDAGPVIVYDGVCILCSAAMRRIAGADRAGRFRYVTGQSALGQALLRHYRLDPQDFETVLLIEDGRAFGKVEMVDRLAALLGGWWRLAALLRLLPARARDWCYDVVARNRYRWFGRKDVCIVPDSSWRKRIIE